MILIWFDLIWFDPRFATLVPSGSFHFWGGWGGAVLIVYNNVWMGYPRRTLWTILQTPIVLCTLSTGRLNNFQHLQPAVPLKKASLVLTLICGIVARRDGCGLSTFLSRASGRFPTFSHTPLVYSRFSQFTYSASTYIIQSINGWILRRKVWILLWEGGVS